jgi:isopenicillin-N N-acyltransferase-like protein
MTPDPYPHVRVSGNARERGHSYGEQARDRVHASISGYERTFAHYTGWDWPRVRREATPFEEPIAVRQGDSLEEMQGIADGAGVEFEDVLAINVRTEVMFSAKARKAADERGAKLPRECSAFAILPDASADGHTLIGQNWDWLVHCFDTVVVLEVEQEGAPDFVTVVEAGLLAKAGMNSSGVGVATNALVTERDLGQPGLPFHVLVRALYDAETLTDALQTLQAGARSSSANYLIAHGDGTAMSVEAAPGDFSDLHLRFPERDVLVHTNHFLSEDARKGDISLWAMPDSAVRFDRTRKAVERDIGSITHKTLEELLADHADYPSGVCCHPDLREALPERGSTIASLVMDLDTKTMWLADGHPCTAPFREVDYGEFLAKPSPLREPVPEGGDAR